MPRVGRAVPPPAAAKPPRWLTCSPAATSPCRAPTLQVRPRRTQLHQDPNRRHRPYVAGGKVPNLSHGPSRSAWSSPSPTPTPGSRCTRWWWRSTSRPEPGQVHRPAPGSKPPCVMPGSAGSCAMRSGRSAACRPSPTRSPPPNDEPSAPETGTTSGGLRLHQTPRLHRPAPPHPPQRRRHHHQQPRTPSQTPPPHVAPRTPGPQRPAHPLAHHPRRLRLRGGSRHRTRSRWQLVGSPSPGPS